MTLNGLTKKYVTSIAEENKKGGWLRRAKPSQHELFISTTRPTMESHENHWSSVEAPKKKRETRTPNKQRNQELRITWCWVKKKTQPGTTGFGLFFLLPNRLFRYPVYFGPISIFVTQEETWIPRAWESKKPNGTAASKSSASCAWTWTCVNKSFFLASSVYPFKKKLKNLQRIV